MSKEREKIQTMLAKIDRAGEMVERQNRLKVLVEQYGYDNVSYATGWSIATINQYCTTKTPLIGLERLTQAENVLEKL